MEKQYNGNVLRWVPRQSVSITPLQKRMQVRFWVPIKIPAEYVSMMPGLPENAKSKIFHGGTLNNKFQE